MPEVEVRSFDDADLHLVAKVIGADDRLDQATIEGDFSAFDQMPVEIRPVKLEEMFLKGHHIVACGFPMGGSPVCSDITNIHRMALQFAGEGFLFPGMSGGPVIDADTGTVIGVNTAVQDNGEVILSSAVEEWISLGIPPQ
jgi:S1-C subfamily serine protease